MQGDYEGEQKTFLEEPAILDKFKAAALITDGKSILSLRQLTMLNHCFY